MGCFRINNPTHFYSPILRNFGEIIQLTEKKYRYAFNGQERDDDVAGDGNTNTALFWEYYTRLGRRWNIDPKLNPWESSYAAFGDNPIWRTDLLGDKYINGHEKEKSEAESNRTQKTEALNTSKDNLNIIKSEDPKSEGHENRLKTATDAFDKATTEKDAADKAYNNIYDKWLAVENKLKELKNINQKEYAKWDSKKYDIEIIGTYSDIKMESSDGDPSKSSSTTESIETGLGEFQGKNARITIKIYHDDEINKGNKKSNDIAHALGHVQFRYYCKPNENLTNEQEEPDANKYEEIFMKGGVYQCP